MISGSKKATLLILGALAALFLVSQVVLGQLILGGRSDLIKAHQHTGYTTVVLGLGALLAIRRRR